MSVTATETKKPRWWAKGMRYLKEGDDLVQWRFYIKTPLGSKQVSAYGRTWTELQDDRKRLEREHEASPTRIRLNELLDRYIENQRTKGADPRNTAMLAQKFEDYVRPKLGSYYLSELCVNWSIIGKVFSDYEDTHPNSRTIQIAFDGLRRAFKFALYNQWATINPCLNVKRPSYEASEPIIFSSEQIWELLRLAQGQDRMMIFSFIMTTLRPGELWGIKRKDLDLENGILKVVTFVTTDEHGNKVEKKPGTGLKNAKGKTPRARRDVPILPSLQQAFRFYLRGQAIGDEDYIFPGPGGKLIHDSGWRRNHFKRLVSKMGLPEATPYDLRHSANSFLADNGVPADIRAAICGHSPDVNLRVYTHPRMEAKREALSNLDALFAGAFSLDADSDKANGKATKDTNQAA